ncbi:restriction endonuclease subunit S [Pseudomonas putida]|uniref:restriction endonuclease subunit S n=1 Tax=Pseudomonas putida TaxID=303 RepID=UPI001555AE15|nr:restriction endonuclease subunit S [Pseudomonas putida]
MRIIENVRLGDIAKVISGFAFKSSEFSDEGVPVVKIANIRVGFLDLDGAQRVNPSYLEKLADKYKVKSGDVLISLTGSHITQPNSVVGRLARASESVPACLLNQRAGKVILNDKDRCDLGFLYYYLTLASLRGDIAAMASGAASQANVSPAQVETLSIDLPPRDEQMRVSSILSAYDDLIENNMRRIEILEEMARRLYEEWFVQFRFPGHEGVELKESELGLIPEGWEVVALEKAVEINPKTKVERDGEKVFVPMGALSETGMVISGWEIKSGNSGAKFQNGDTLVARISPCLENGKTGFVDFLPASQPTACGSTEFIVLRSRSLCPEMVYCLSRSDRFREVAMKSMSGATGRQRVRVESLVGYPIAQPEGELVAKYHAFAQPCFKEIRGLANKNANLRQQRDLLLPKLISGEIDVSDIPMPT